jgi:hypothetical protein
MADVDKWKALRQQWELVIEEADVRIRDLESKLRTCNVESLGVLQAKIAVFESLKRFPDDVIEREGE